jgi:hypothetical protein
VVEHLPSKQRVAGSIPVSRSRSPFSYLEALVCLAGRRPSQGS